MFRLWVRRGLSFGRSLSIGLMLLSAGVAEAAVPSRIAVQGGLTTVDVWYSTAVNLSSPVLCGTLSTSAL